MPIFSFRDKALFARLIGDMVSGVLDKNQFGATAYSLTHAFFELYGGKYSGKLLSALSKIFTNFLHTEGFTLGVRDIVVTDAANKKRKQVMEETAQVGKSCAGLVTNSVVFFLNCFHGKRSEMPVRAASQLLLSEERDTALLFFLQETLPP